jgi:hypothetical protein
MKKVLVLLSMASVAQGLSAERTQYKHLNQLNGHSEIRKKCEEVKPARFIRGSTERACDTLNNRFDLIAQDIAAALSGKDIKGIEEKIPNHEEFCNMTKPLDLKNKNVEAEYVAVLMQHMVDEAALKYNSKPRRMFR